jgi:hypothetical protein
MKAPEISYLLGVVLYKEDISVSNTIGSLILIKDFLNSKNYKIVIWDNSPEKQNKAELDLLTAFNCYEYVHTPKNLSLAKVYNTIYQTNKEYNLLILFDQDSKVSKDYFVKLSIAEEENNSINLFLPIIKVDNLIYSPANRFLVTGRHWDKERYGAVECSKKLAITSGMAIRTNYLRMKSETFNEDLTIYGIDTDFMIQFEKNNLHFFVLDYSMIHQLSLFENESIEKKLFRFSNHKKSLIKIFRNESFLKFCLVKVLIAASCLKLSFKYKTIQFLFIKND